MGTLRERQAALAGRAAERDQRLRDQLERYRQTHPGRASSRRPRSPLEPQPFMRPLRDARDYEAGIGAPRAGGPTVLAFLFAMPETDAIRMLDARGDYFDVRTGDMWDLFFPGYYRASDRGDTGQQARDRPVGHDYAENWRFSVSAFDALRDHVEQASERRWVYSGDADLVLVNAWLPAESDPAIDWVSTIAGQVTDQGAGTRTLTLAGIVEKITRDFETGAEDPSYGTGEITGGPPAERGHAGRDFMISTLSGIAAALGAKVLGI